MKTNTAAFSARDKRLMIGFAIFAESILGYMLFLDGPLGRIQKLRTEVATAQKALTTLQASVTVRTEADRKQPPLPSILKLKPGQSASLVLQDTLDTLTRQSGATPIGTNFTSQEADRCQIKVRLEGSYEAISRFSHALEHPPYLMGLEKLSVQPKEDQPDRLVAEWLLTVLYQKD